MFHIPKPKTRSKAWLLLIPPVLFIAVFLLYPLCQIFFLSFVNNGGVTLEFYQRLFTDDVYLRVLLLTFRISFIVTLITLVLGYPVAYTMTICSKRAFAVIMMCIMVPFWTSLLVRTYAWMVLLGNHGVINNFLLHVGLIHQPLHLLYNDTGVIIGMTHVLLPYMILSLYSVMQGIDRNLLGAARNLGANGFVAFWRVYFPLSIQGISSGSILVFIMGIGYFITPALLGGQKNTMISQLIQTQVSSLLNWGFGSAIAFVLLAVTMLILLVSKKILHVEKIW